MKAVCWHATEDVRVEQVPDPQILRPRDAIVRVTSTAICGSDLHLYDGYIPTMKSGDILGHEFMGEVVEVGPDVKKLRVGDRVVVPFAIGCGQCWYCQHDYWSLCDNSNPNAFMLEAFYGYSGSGLFGYSHLFGGYAGGQAEYARVPFADIGPIKVPDGLDDDQVLFLSDILPTGWEAVTRGEVREGDVVAVWGCGPVGQFVVRSAFLQGADRVIAIDRFPRRLELARKAGAETVEYSETDDLIEVLKETTGGRGPDVCIDAVGLEAHGTSIDAVADRLKQKVRLEMDRANVLRQVFQACGKGGRVSVIGVYGGFIDKFPFGAIFGKGLTVRAGQCNVQAFMRPLLERIERGEIDPTEIITHRLPLDDAPRAYQIFRDKMDECVKVVLKPNA
jgi:threonine dehydrogenase-like Zn-dependent dehydrogenase